MTKTMKAIAGWAPLEVAQAIEDYAKRHGIAQSAAVVTLCAKGLRLAKPTFRKRGRQLGWRKPTQ